MSRYRLLPPEGTCTFRKIVTGRKWVGRVYQNNDGTWRAAMFKREIGQGTTPTEAFFDGVAKYLGFPDDEALRLHNQNVRSQNRYRREQTRQAMNQFLSGNFSALDALFTRSDK